VPDLAKGRKWSMCVDSTIVRSSHRLSVLDRLEQFGEFCSACSMKVLRDVAL
jgi:hypothetical protein